MTDVPRTISGAAFGRPRATGSLPERDAGPAAMTGWAGSADDAAELFGELTALLWRERETLERLLFKLTEQLLLLGAGQTRWLPFADAEVREAAKTLQTYELARAAQVEQLAQRHGVAADTTLGQLADSAPEPWPLVLHEHRDALRTLAAEIDAATAENRRLLKAGESATREALSGISDRTDPVRTSSYGPRAGAPLGGSFLLDEQA